MTRHWRKHGEKELPIFVGCACMKQVLFNAIDFFVFFKIYWSIVFVSHCITPFFAFASVRQWIDQSTQVSLINKWRVLQTYFPAL